MDFLRLSESAEYKQSRPAFADLQLIIWDTVLVSWEEEIKSKLTMVLLMILLGCLPWFSW